MTDRLSFDVYSCVRVYYRYADCDRCVQVCPSGAISIENDKVQINFQNCVECGACVGNCPTESFSIRGFDPNNFVEAFSKAEENLISCKLNVPCLSSLDSQHLATIALKKQSNITLDTGHCKECSIGKQLKVIQENVEEANYILSCGGQEFKVLKEDIAFLPVEKRESSRRSILKLFAKKTAALAFWAIEDKIPLSKESSQEERDYKNIVSEKVTPFKRLNLINSLSSVGVCSGQFEVSKVRFTSDKWIDNNCTNCGICGNICPTGAIATSDDRLKILFNPSLCIKCRICHDVCPEKCLHLQDNLSVESFIENNYKVLASHVMIACSECLVPFSYKGDSTVCPRCRKLEDEIRELLKIGD